MLSHRMTARVIEPTSLGASALHQRILADLDPVGEQLRAGQDVAQIVADLGHGAAKLRQPLLLLQRMGQLGLQLAAAPPRPRAVRSRRRAA